MHKNRLNQSICSLFFIATLAFVASAQTTEFTYQGRLTDGSIAAHAVYDFEFSLFDAETGGTPLGTQQRLGVGVVNGIFTVRLDFGAAFDGNSRWLSISVRPSGGAEFTLLDPRQPISSSPYAIKSLSSESAETANTANTAANALQLGGVAADQYVVTTDPRMSDARPPTAGSPNYIQNQNAGAQPMSDFHVSGDGRADGTLTGNIVNSTVQYNIGGQRVLGVLGINNTFIGRDAGTVNTGTRNTFAGHNAGAANTTGAQNSFFGSVAGSSNTTGSLNAFFGDQSGGSNTTGQNNAYFGFGSGSLATGSFNAFFGSAAGLRSTGSNNSFFGWISGRDTTTGGNNSFFGAHAGLLNITGSSNAFFGHDSGRNNTSGHDNAFFGVGSGFDNTLGFFNAFFGRSAGLRNSTGNRNTFVGLDAGNNNLTGSDNTVVGANANVASGALSFATAIGAGTVVSSSNSIVLGRSGGQDTVSIPGTGTAAVLNVVTQYNVGGSRVLSVAGVDNAFLGIGAGSANTGAANSFFGRNAGTANVGGFLNAFFGAFAGRDNVTGESNSFFGALAGSFNTASNNSFFGRGAGFNNVSGQGNSFFGSFTADQNTTGSQNSFFGVNTGGTNTTGSNNTLIGAGTDVLTSGLNFATAIGAGSRATASNTIVLGRNGGEDSVRIPGSLNLLGSLTGSFLVVTGNGGTGLAASGAAGNVLRSNGAIWTSTALQAGDLPAGNTNYVQNRTTLQPGVTNFNISGTGTANSMIINTEIQAAQAFFTNTGAGRLIISTLGGEAGTLPLCLNSVVNRVNLCSSSLRYKSNVSDLRAGTDLINRLRPVTFTWNDSGTSDLGLIAEEVGAVEPSLVFHNTDGEIQGVKYDRLGVILVNVVREQQARIDSQQAQLDEYRKTLDTLKAMICKLDRQGGACEEEK